MRDTKTVKHVCMCATGCPAGGSHVRPFESSRKMKGLYGPGKVAKTRLETLKAVCGGW